ncbi:MAG TPA: LCP family protein [Jiangellaceae bacterium]
MGTLVPGTGLIAAGRRSGKAVLTVLILGVLAGGVFLSQTSLSQLTGTATNRSWLMFIAVAMLLVAVGWLTVALASHRALEPSGLSDGKRFAGSLVVIAAASVVITPLALGAQYAWTARTFIGNVSSDSDTAPELDAADPWEGVPRINVLLMGGDGGIGRQGIRADTLILASIDTDSGETIMFSLPRQLASPPFPADSKLAEYYPDGFTDAEQNLINAVYNNTPEDVLNDAFPNSDNPRADATKEAVEGTLGIPVDYYVLANLDGFEQIVDAMGGVTIDVPYPIPMGTKVSNGQCVWSGPNGVRWIAPGDAQELSGEEALWFARSRCAPYDAQWPDQTGLQSPITLGANHNRMERQRCMMGAIAANANPMNLLTKFQGLASAAEDAVATDIPPDLWSAFAELGLKIKSAGIASLTFNNEILDGGAAGTTADPNYEEIHTLVQEAISPEVDLDETVETSTDAGSGDGGPDESSDGQDSEESTSEESESQPDDDGTQSEQSSGDGTEPASPAPEADPTEPTDVTATC